MSKNIQNIQRYPGGNTKTPGYPRVSGQYFKWFFTLKSENIQNIQLWEVLDELSKKFHYQLELSESGYEHYQGCFSVHHKETFKAMKNRLGFSVIHLERCEDWLESVAYCTKKETRIDGPWNKSKKPINCKKPEMEWCTEVYDILAEKPDYRTIHWFVDTKGNNGKSWLTKWIWLNYKNVLLLNGKRNDIEYQVLKNGGCDIAIYDVPRTNSDYVSYQSLENIKNGLVTSGKYEGGTVAFNNPHVIVFANCEPDYKKMSKDRWQIHYINEQFAGDFVDGFALP